MPSNNYKPQTGGGAYGRPENGNQQAKKIDLPEVKLADQVSSYVVKSLKKPVVRVGIMVIALLAVSKAMSLILNNSAATISAYKNFKNAIRK